MTILLLQVSNLGPVVLIWKHGTRVLTAGVGAVAMHVKRDHRVRIENILTLVSSRKLW